MSRAPTAMDRITIELEHLGIQTLRRVNSGAREIVRRVECHACGAVEEFKSAPRVATEGVLKIIGQRGWTVGKRLQCPSCNGKSRKETMAMVDQKRDVPVDVVSPSVAQVVAISRLLDAHFVDGAYLNGYSDRRVSEETGCPMVMVQKVRRDAFPPMIDPEVLALRSDLTTIQAMLAEAVTRLAAVEKNRDR